MAPIKTVIVIVPGAFHLPECYEIFRQQLEDAGFDAISIAHKSVFLDGETTARAQSHHDDTNHICEVVKPLLQAGRDVVIFCHSYGGIPTTEALNDPELSTGSSNGVLHVFYCCAVAIGQGQSISWLGEQMPDDMPTHWTEVDADGVTLRVKQDSVDDALYNDVSPDLVAEVHKHLGSMSRLPFASPLTAAVYKEGSCTYILCEEDNVIMPKAQEYMCENAGIKDVVRLKSSHSPFLSKPAKLVLIIEETLRRRKARNESIT